MRTAASVALAASYHEAGHAVASWRQGDGIGGVTIMPGLCPRGFGADGGRMTLVRGGDRSAASGWGHRHLVTLLAGAAAQRAHNPRSCVLSCARFDISDARGFAGVMCRSAESERALLTWAQAEARALVSENWHLIDVLARILFRAQTIEGGVATAILETIDIQFLVRKV